MSHDCVLRRRLTELLVCSVCKETYREPKALSCGHSFCASCIESIHRQSSHTNCIPCPLCREDFFPPQRLISNIPRNTFIQDVLDVLNSENEASCAQESKCGLCPSSNVHSVCMKCNARMCSKCTNVHNQLKKHSQMVFTLSDIIATPLMEIFNEKEKFQNCPNHTDNQLTNYCTTCNAVLCEQCNILHDGTHKNLAIEEAADGFKDYLAFHLEELKPEIQRLTKNLDAFQQDLKELCSSSEKTKSEIKETAANLRALIDTKKEESLKILEEMYTTRSKALHDCIEATKCQLVQRKSLFDYMHALDKYGTKLLLAKNKEGIQQRIGQLKCDEEALEERIHVPDPRQFQFYYSGNSDLLKKIKDLNIGDVKDAGEAVLGINDD